MIFESGEKVSTLALLDTWSCLTVVFEIVTSFSAKASTITIELSLMMFRGLGWKVFARLENQNKSPIHSSDVASEQLSLCAQDTLR